MPRLATLSCLLFALAATLPVFAQQGGVQVPDAGLALVTLSAEDLNTIQQLIGHRVGVGILEVTPNSLGAAAGYNPGDVIFAVGQVGVDSAEAAAAAFANAQGAVECSSGVFVNGEMQFKVVTLNLGAVQGGGAVPVGGVAQPQPVGVAQPGADDPLVAGINAYYDILDFTRSQAWGRQVVTQGPDRERAYNALLQAAGQADLQQVAAAFAVFPPALQQLQQTWGASDEAARNALRAEWRDKALSPLNMYPPPANVQQFTAEGNAVAFQYPGDWTGGFQQAQGATLLFIGPKGDQAAWDAVVDTPRSPVGVLFAMADLTQEMRGLDYTQAARLLAQQLMPNAVAGFREVEAVPIGNAGAVITLVGSFPGGAEEHFYWFALTGFGADKVFAARAGGPMAQAEALLPAYRHIVATMALNPPQQAGGGEGGSWRTAWDRIETASIAKSWATFHSKD
jgi:hypothetical protein